MDTQNLELIKGFIFQKILETTRLKENTVYWYADRLYNKVFKNDVPNHNNKNYNLEEYNKDILDRIRGLLTKDIKGNLIDSSISGTHDTRMFYYENGEKYEVLDADKFASLVVDYYKKKYANTKDDLDIIKRHSKKFFYILKNDSIMKKKGIDRKLLTGNNKDDYDYTNA